MYVELTNKEKRLIATFLFEYSDRLSNDGCNDFDFPPDWTEEEKIEFVREYHEWNGDEDEMLLNENHIANFCAVDLLAHKILTADC